ncbi:MAG: hypothetical protein HGB18_05110, partial [Candidatus Moranbacteria bacterium]|nr:hypothetical protein [Candidatus Moranbacteria bacterium]
MFPLTVSLSLGDAVPIPTFPVPAVVPVPKPPVAKMRLPILSWLLPVALGASM